MNYLNFVVVITSLLLVLVILVVNLMSLYRRDKNVAEPADETLKPLLGVVHPE